jgi:hypothetical protein
MHVMINQAPSTNRERSITEPPNQAHGPWRRLSAQANEADIRVVPEPGMLLVLVAGITLLSGLNIICREKLNRLTLERRKKQDLGNVAQPQTGSRALSRKNDLIV